MPDASPPASPDPVRRWRWVLLPLALLPTIGVLHAPFLTNYDDFWAIDNNPLIKHGFGYLPRLFTEGTLEHGHMQLAYASLAFDHLFFGSFAGGYRIVNALIHGLSALLVFRIGCRLLRGRTEAALLAALVFVVHPTAVETVAWVIQRNNALAQLFGLAALAVYLGDGTGSQQQTEAARGTRCDGPSWRRVAGSALLLLLAQISKTSAVSFFAAFAALELFFCSGPAWRRAARAGVMLLPCLAGAAWGLSAHAEQVVPVLGGPSAAGRLLGMLHLYGRAWCLLLWPAGLSAFYHVSPQLPPFDAAMAAAVLIPLVWLALYRALKLPLGRAVLLLAWFVGALLPTMNPCIGISFLLQDRYVYLALVPCCLLFADAVAAAGARVLTLRNGQRLGVALLVIVLGATSALRSLDWRSPGRLFLDATFKQPRTAFGHAYYAMHLFFLSNQKLPQQQKDQLLTTALAEHEAAARCDDFERLVYPLFLKNERARIMLAQSGVARARGDRDRASRLAADARALFLEVWQGRPERATEKGAKFQALKYLAFEALDSSRFEEGLRYLETGLQLAPENPELLLCRVAAWEQMGRDDDARREAERLIARPELAPHLRPILDRIAAKQQRKSER